MKYPPLLLDIMHNGRFVCQLKYSGRPFPSFVDGKIVPVYDGRDIEKFVFQQRPSLLGKNIRIEFSTQKVLSR